MGIEESEGDSPADKMTLTLLTTKFLRETRTSFEKIRNVIALGIYAAASGIIIAFIIAYFSKSYLEESLQLSREVAEAIFSYSIAAGSVGFLAIVIVGGAFSDDYRSKYGHRAPFILLGCLLSGFMLLLTPIIAGSFAGTAYEDLMYILFPLCFFIIYIGLGLATSPFGALLSELFTKEQRGWVGLVLAGFAILGSSIGLVFLDKIAALLFTLSETLQLNFLLEFGLFLFPALTIIIAGVLTFILVEKANPPFAPLDSTINDIKKTPSYIMLGGSDFGKMFFVQSFWGFAAETVSIYLFIHLTTSNSPISSEEAPIVLLLVGVASAIMAIPAGLFIQKFGKVKTAIVGSLIYSGFCFLLAGMEIGDYYSLILIIAAFGGFGAVFIESVRVSLPADLVPEGKEAQFMGINKFGATWTMPLVAIVGGFLLTALVGWSYSATAIMFGLAGLATLAATILLFLISYEKMLRTEYNKFYKRYLTARGFLEDQVEKVVDQFI